MKKYLKSTVERRKERTRKTVKSTMKVRLCVFRSNQHISVQLIDDQKSLTLASSSSLEKDFPLKSSSNCEAAQWVGRKIGQKAIELGTISVVFDRGGYRFHGRVKALAEGAREAGLAF